MAAAARFFQIGGGSSIEFLLDPWITWIPSGIPRASFNPSTLAALRPLDCHIVSDVLVSGTRIWNRTLVEELLDSDSAKNLRITPLFHWQT